MFYGAQTAADEPSEKLDKRCLCTISYEVSPRGNVAGSNGVFAEAENATQGSTVATFSPDNRAPAEKTDTAAVIASASVSEEWKLSATAVSAFVVNVLESREGEATTPGEEVQPAKCDVERDAEMQEGGSKSVTRPLEEQPEEEQSQDKGNRIGQQRLTKVTSRRAR